MMTNKKIKILVTYKDRHKIIASDIFTPIQTGRAIADEVFGEMIGDDTGEHISNKNPYFCEMSAIYWAWKNYEQLGNPEYIGFMHYRRHLLFNPDVKFSNDVIKYKSIDDDYLNNALSEHEVSQYLDRYDILAGQFYTTNKSIEAQYAQHHSRKDFLITEEIIKKSHPDYYNTFLKCKKSKSGYYLNMFVMPKKMFFEYCEFIFSVLFECVDQFNMDGRDEYQRRLFISERLTNVFLEKKKQEGVRVKNLPVSFIQSTYSPVNLTPAFANNNTPVVLSCSDEYVPYLLTCLYSLKEHSSTAHNYDIIICENSITKSNKSMVKKHTEQENISVRFLTIDDSSFPDGLDDLYKGRHYSKESFFRIYLPRLLPAYDKVLYLDADIIILSDVYDLYDTNLDGNTIGACKDAIVNAIANQTPKIKKYFINDLGLKNHKNYFQAGVMLFDCRQFRKNDCESKLLSIMKTVKVQFADQCILNALFEGDVKFMDLSWNYENENIAHGPMNLINDMDESMLKQYFAARENPKIIHYIGGEKPWIYPDANFASIWWKYARKAPIYEQILLKMTLSHTHYQSHNLLNSRQTRSFVKYLRYKLLSKITFGSTRERYKRKYKSFK